MCWAATPPAIRPTMVLPTCDSIERGPADAKSRSYAPPHDRYRCGGSRIGVSGRRPHGAGGRSCPVARIGTRRTGIDRDLSSGPGRSAAARRPLCAGRTASGAAVQSLPGRLRHLHAQPDWYSCFSRRRYGGAAESIAAVCRSDQRRVRSDGAAAVAALCRSFFLRPTGSGRSIDRATDGSPGEGGLRRSVCERGPDSADPARRSDYAERHRAGIRHGPRLDGTPWRVGLADPDRPGVLTETIDLVDRAVATSAGAGFRFDSKGRFTHLFDPSTGRSPSLYRTVSVIAPTATEADALSTAFSLMPVPRIRNIVAARSNLQARIVEAGGTLIVCGA